MSVLPTSWKPAPNVRTLIIFPRDGRYMAPVPLDAPPLLQLAGGCEPEGCKFYLATQDNEKNSMTTGNANSSATLQAITSRRFV